MSSPVLTVIGLDSATFDVVDPMLAAGELPNLARLCDSGARGVLRSTTHPLTPHAWATIVTGVNAGRHGIWDFTERDETGYQLRLVNVSFRRAPAVWDRLRRSGRRTGIVNVPFTWPAPEVDGFAFLERVRERHRLATDGADIPEVAGVRHPKQPDRQRQVDQDVGEDTPGLPEAQ